MRVTKDSTVRGVVLSLLSAIVLLIPLSVALNRLSFGPSSNQGFNLAGVFSSPPGTNPQKPAASTSPFSGDSSKNPSIDTDSADSTSNEFSSPEHDDSSLQSDRVTESSANAPSPDGNPRASEFSYPEYDGSRLPDLEMDLSDIAPSLSGNSTATEDLEAESSDSSTTPADESSPEGGVESAGNGTSVAEPEESHVSSFFDAEVQSPSSIPATPASVEFESNGDNADDLVDPGSSFSVEESTPDSTQASPLPEGSEDHVVAIPSVVPSSSTSEIVEPGPANRSEAKRQRVFQPASIPHYSFVKFSAYRQSMHTFFVTGISSYVARAFDKDMIAHTCEWHPANGTIPLSVHSDPKKFVETEARMIYMKSDENHGTYSPTIINCTFAKAVGVDRKGGLLVVRISTGYDRWEPNLPVVAMEELAGEVDVVMTPPEKLPFKYAFCGAPMHGKLSPERILQWMTYHHYLAEGRGHFFVYNMGGLAESDKTKFQHFLAAGLLSITDILDPNLEADYPTWYYHQVLLINDCLHRSRFMAERVFFIDYDEFVQIPAPDTFSRFMKRHKDQPWISFGSIPANTHDCSSPTPGEEEEPIERMLWRLPQPGCKLKPEEADPWLCIGPVGRRKYVANPRETFAAGVHWVTIPENGLDLKAQEARIVHYRGAQLLDKPVCVVDVSEGSSEEQVVLQNGWVRDDSIAKVYAKAKSFLGL